MTKLLSLVGVVALTSSFSLAQTLVAPVGAATADGGGTSQNYFRELAARWQMIYDTSVFTNQGVFSPIQINQISFRPVAGGVVPAVPYTYSGAEVYVMNSAVDHAAPNTTFALNRTVTLPATPNYTGNVTVNTPSGATPVNSDDVVIVLTTPFIYDPSLGQDLLIEVFLPAAPSPLPVLATDVPVRTCGYPITTAKMSTVRFVGATAPTVTGGSITNWTPVTKIDYSIPPGVAKHDPYGRGCYDVANSFYERFPGAFPASTNDLSNLTLNGVMNGNGGYTVFSVPGSTIVPPTTPGLALGDDVVSTAIALPFTFDYPGGSTSSIYVDSNGSIVLNAAAAPASFNNSTSAANILTQVNHRLYAALMDMLPDGATNVQNVFAEVDPTNPNIFLITWLNVPNFIDPAVNTPSGLTSTFQIALIDGGATDTFEFRYGTVVNDSDSYSGAMITGFSLGNNALDGGNQDLSGTVVNTSTELPGLALFGSPRPVLGNTVSYSLSNVRPNAGICSMMASFTQFPTGVPMTTYGFNAPGCNLFIDPLSSVGFGPLLLGAPTSSFSHTWPTGPWSGVLIFVQGFELAPGQNGLGVLASNGMKVELGTL